jgi:carbonic anhydrase
MPDRSLPRRLAAVALVLVAAAAAQGAPLALASPAPEPALCVRGQRQSPIDIDPASALPLAQDRLAFEYHSAPLHLVNDGHTVRARFAPGSRLMLNGVPHTLQQFHFHTPGGDRVQGEEFPLAMHFLHKSPQGGLVTVVLLFRLGAENAALAALLPDLPRPGAGPVQRPDRRVDPAAWLPAGTAHYSYLGSLTAPPCTEGVRWIVMKQVLEISAAQLAQLAERVPVNARPVQPLHARIVSESP